MEKVKMTLDEKIKLDLEKNLEESLKNDDFCTLIKRCKIKKKDALNNNMKLLDTLDELNHCKNCQGLMMCKNKVQGYVFYPSYEMESLKFVYMPCKYQKELEKKRLEKESNLKVLDYARIRDIDVTDKNRAKVIKWLKQFYDNYEKVNSLKGLYLHGNFGCGKTYLISAFLNELRINKNAVVEVVYFPELLRSLKDNFDDLEDKMNYLQNVDILLIDDIGAENVTAWGRDEILGTILQYRMNHKLTTFFTSNFNIEELEKQLAIAKGSEDLVKARRIIERIKQLCDVLEVISVNRRN